MVELSWVVGMEGGWVRGSKCAFFCSGVGTPEHNRGGVDEAIRPLSDNHIVYSRSGYFRPKARLRWRFSAVSGRETSLGRSMVCQLARGHETKLNCLTRYLSSHWPPVRQDAGGRQTTHGTVRRKTQTAWLRDRRWETRVDQHCRWRILALSLRRAAGPSGG